MIVAYFEEHAIKALKTTIPVNVSPVPCAVPWLQVHATAQLRVPTCKAGEEQLLVHIQGVSLEAEERHTWAVHFAIRGNCQRKRHGCWQCFSSAPDRCSTVHNPLVPTGNCTPQTRPYTRYAPWLGCHLAGPTPAGERAVSDLTKSSQKALGNQSRSQGRGDWEGAERCLG